mmetsp:Transcript_12107/g.24671  ORF Transcript_12107/g.24671 Transcript_12107/m.24671 type:complete len:91 (+) Transcript_12107:80-352(+)
MVRYKQASENHLFAVSLQIFRIFGSVNLTTMWFPKVDGLLHSLMGFNLCLLLSSPVHRLLIIVKMSQPEIFLLISHRCQFDILDIHLHAP